jgi:hypothetical protein
MADRGVLPTDPDICNLRDDVKKDSLLIALLTDEELLLAKRRNTKRSLIPAMNFAGRYQRQTALQSALCYDII